jgi:hypothetical protein
MDNIRGLSRNIGARAIGFLQVACTIWNQGRWGILIGIDGDGGFTRDYTNLLGHSGGRTFPVSCTWPPKEFSWECCLEKLTALFPTETEQNSCITDLFECEYQSVSLFAMGKLGIDVVYVRPYALIWSMLQLHYFILYFGVGTRTLSIRVPAFMISQTCDFLTVHRC